MSSGDVFLTLRQFDTRRYGRETGYRTRYMESRLLARTWLALGSTVPPPILYANVLLQKGTGLLGTLGPGRAAV